MRKALGEDKCQEMVRKIEQALAAGQMDEAIAVVRSCVPEGTFATLRMRPLEDFQSGKWCTSNPHREDRKWLNRGVSDRLLAFSDDAAKHQSAVAAGE